MKGKSLYDDLGVARDASPEDIKSAHRKGVKKAHPDAGGSTEKFHALQRAFDVLSNPDKRAHYDRTGEAEQPNTAHIHHAALVKAVYQLLQKVINSPVDLVHTDIRAMCLQDLAETARNIEAQLQQTRETIRRVEQAKARFKKGKPSQRKLKEGESPPPEGLVEQVLTQQLVDLRELLDKGIEARDHHTRVTAVFEAMAYDHERQPLAYTEFRMYGPGTNGLFGP